MFKMKKTKQQKDLPDKKQQARDNCKSRFFKFIVDMAKEVLETDKFRFHY